jgi:outer membrane protein assembly factor BamB
VIRPDRFVWAFPEIPPYEDEATPMKNAPAVDHEGRIILCAQDRLFAIVEEERRAKVVWEYVTGSHVPGTVVVDGEGNIRVHTCDGLLHCVSPAGKQIFSPAHVGEPLGWAAPLVDSEGNTYVSAYDGGLLKVDPNGKMDKRPYVRSRRKFDSAGVIHNEVLYIGSEDGYVFAIELRAERGRNIWDHASEQGYTGGFVNSSPAVTSDGIIVVSARDETLYGFGPGGSIAWSTKLPGLMLGSPVIDPHGHIYIGVSQAQRGREGRGLLVCVDGNSHKIRWQYQAAGPVESTPAIGDEETIYFGDNSGTIHALDTRGNARWTAEVECAVRSATTIIAPNRVAFGLDDDTLVVLECSSEGLAETGWPKIGQTLGQTGVC